jgi:hypothetical protein
VVDDLSAGNASPSKKVFTQIPEFFIIHKPTAFATFHDVLLTVLIFWTFSACCKIPVVSG